MHHTDESSFIAMVEGRNGLPVYGVQFHPEKALFEWSPQLHYPHSETAVLANRKIADFFVHQVRQIQKRSPVGFADFKDESEYAIYNYESRFTGVDINATHAVYTETYLIN
jgi:gamma-glutamyl hydrolase